MNNVKIYGDDPQLNTGKAGGRTSIAQAERRASGMSPRQGAVLGSPSNRARRSPKK